MSDPVVLYNQVWSVKICGERIFEVEGEICRRFFTKTPG